MSLIFMSGFVGVSIQSTFVTPGRIAARTASWSVSSTVVRSIPQGTKTRLTRRWVPP
jgi:hypothetical protein